MSNDLISYELFSGDLGPVRCYTQDERLSKGMSKDEDVGLPICNFEFIHINVARSPRWCLLACRGSARTRRRRPSRGRTPK